MLPKLFNYTNRNTKAIGVSVGDLDLYFSYETVIAFRHNSKLVVRENDWGPTTGRHLNEIDGGEKKNRLPSEEFEKQLEGVA